MFDKDTKISAARLTVTMAAVLLILQALSLAVSLRYAYVSTDILAQTEAGILVTVAAILSPLVTYSRFAFLLWGCFFMNLKRSFPLFWCAAASVILGSGCDILLSAILDPYFAGNEGYYLLASLLSLAISFCSILFLWVYAAEKGKKFAKDPKKKRALLPVFLWTSIVMFIIDALYRSYTVLSMALSDEGVSFACAEDVWYLVFDYVYPLAEAALGFGFMCLCALVFKRLFVKKNG